VEIAAQTRSAHRYVKKLQPTEIVEMLAEVGAWRTFTTTMKLIDASAAERDGIVRIFATLAEKNG